MEVLVEKSSMKGGFMENGPLDDLLVGGFNPSEKYLSIGMIIPNIWKNEKCSKPPTILHIKNSEFPLRCSMTRRWVLLRWLILKCQLPDLRMVRSSYLSLSLSSIQHNLCYNSDSARPKA